MRRLGMMFSAAIVLSLCVQLLGVSAASQYVSPAFQGQWREGEAGIPNFWGPLATARDGQREAYKEAPDGQRLVQYFDKARMELTNPATGSVTTGLLTVEMVTGQLQSGDNTFEQRAPAKIAVAGDPRSPGVTYADLARAPKFADPGATGSGPPVPWVYDNGMFNPKGNVQYKRDGNRYVPVTPDGPFYPFDRPGSANAVRIEGGPYGQIVYGAFVQFLQPLGTGADRVTNVVQTVGYPITPFFFARTTIKGTAQWVIVQAFERRVLTMTAGGVVEFGNIGQHYYQWRYASPAPASTGTPAASPTPTLTPAAATTPTPGAQVDFGPFAKPWFHEGYQLLVGADGYARSDERTDTACGGKGADPGIPCEDVVGTFSAHAIIQFTSVSGDTASGKVLRSNYPGKYPTGASVMLTLKPYGIAQLALGADKPLAVCGPDYGKLAPPGLISPCGT